MNLGDSENHDDAHNAGNPDNPWTTPMTDRLYDSSDPTWPMVVVQWRDAHQDSDTWVFTNEYVPEEMAPITVGWVWPKCKEGYLTLVGTVHPSALHPEMVSNINHIPMENIIRMYSLTTHLPVNWFDEGIA